MHLPSKIVRPRRFPSTDWSVVSRACNRSNPTSQAALARLCEDYWYPLYSYLRQRGHSRDYAEEITQTFFARLLEGPMLSRYVRLDRVRFRSFLLACLQNLVANEGNRARSAKRTGRPCAAGYESASGWDRGEPIDGMSPEQIYERQWARTLLLRVLGRLRSEFVQTGKSTIFEHLKGYLVGDSAAPSYFETARRLGFNEGAVAVMVHRLRRRYRTLLRDEVARTVTSPHDIEAELHYLRVVLRGGGGLELGEHASPDAVLQHTRPRGREPV